MIRGLLALLALLGGVLATTYGLNIGQPPAGRPPGGLPASGPQAGAPPAAGAGQPAQQAQTGGPRPAGGAPGAGGPPQRPPVPVVVGKAEKKSVAIRVDSLGTVQPFATVTLRPRVEAHIEAVLVADGAEVKAGDVMFILDSRTISAQVKQADANLAKSRAQLEQAERDVARNEALAKNEFASRQKLDDSRTAVKTISATIAADAAALESLRAQLTFYEIKSPVNGRVGAISLKAGNIAKTGDGSPVLAVINQIKPIYVVFSVAQRSLTELRQAMEAGTASVSVTPQGFTKSVEGKVAFIDNTVDTTSGAIAVRGVFENADNSLWPGVLSNVRVTLRHETAVTVPREAVQVSQSGHFVFVVENGAVKIQPVKLGRSVDDETIVTEGLKGTETVVVDGQMQLTNNARVQPRDRARTSETPQQPAPRG